MPDILREIESQISQAKTAVTKQNVGTIRELADGVAKVEGLSEAMLNEMIDLGKGITGLALNLEETEVGVILMGDYTQLEEGDEVRTTGKLLQVPVGKPLLGRVVNTLGEPIDGKGPIQSEVFYPVERMASGIISRREINQPVQTGIMPIDAMIPIGRGQRELIIGDRATGKTTICIDTIIHQARLNKAAQEAGDPGFRPLYCIYVAIGQKESSVARLTATLEKAGAKPLACATGSDGKIDLLALMDLLAAKKIDSIMVEGGARVITSFVNAKLVDLFIITIAPKLVGGLPVLNSRGLDGAPYLECERVHYQQLGRDIIVWARPGWETA